MGDITDFWGHGGAIDGALMHIMNKEILLETLILIVFSGSLSIKRPNLSNWNQFSLQRKQRSS